MNGYVVVVLLFERACAELNLGQRLAQGASQRL